MTRSDAMLYFGPATILAAAVLVPPFCFILYTSVHDTSFSLEAYRRLLGSVLFQRVLWTTLQVSVICAVVSVVVGYPVALHLARQSPRRRAFLMIMVLMPLWTSILVKSFSFEIILGRDGLVNSGLSWILQHRVALPMILNRFGVIVGMANYLVPFVILSVLASLLSIDPALPRALEIMGAKPPRIFFTVTLPLSLPGVLAALSSTIVMSLGIFVVPSLLGGRRDLMMANLVDFYTRETLDWHAASAIGVTLLVIVAVVGLPALRLQRRVVDF